MGRAKFISAAALGVAIALGVSSQDGFDPLGADARQEGEVTRAEAVAFYEARGREATGANVLFVVAGLAARLAPGGDLVFSVETLPEGDYSWVLQCQERYAHDDAYVARVAAAAGLGVVEQTRFQPRTESGYPVRGTLHVLRKRKYSI